MKQIPLVIILLAFNVVTAQNEKEKVKNTIDSFFESFHNQDSVTMKKNVSEKVIIQSIGENQ